MLHALIQVLLMLLWLLGLVIIIQAILSWLVAFNVINTYNDFVRSLPLRARPDHRAALPADPQDPARFRRARFLAPGGACDHLGAADLPRRHRQPDPCRELLMTAAIIDGKAFAAGAARARRRLRSRPSSTQAGREPGLAVVLVGDDPASRSMSASKGKATRGGGHGELRASPAATRRARTICSPWSRELNADERGRRHPRPAAAAAADRRRRR